MKSLQECLTIYTHIEREKRREKRREGRREGRISKNVSYFLLGKEHTATKKTVFGKQAAATQIQYHIC